MSANAYLLERETRHAIFVQRYAGGVWNDLKPILRSLRQDLLARLANAPTEYQATRIAQLLIDVQSLTQAAGDQMRQQLERDLIGFAQYEAEFQGKLLSGAITTQATLPTAEALAGVVTRAPAVMVGQSETVGQMVQRFARGVNGSVQTAIQAGYIEGATVQQMSRNVARLVDTRSARQAEALVRTAVNHIGSEARAEVYKQNSDVLEGEKYTATLDSRTTLTCAGFDGKIFPVGEGPQTPQHYNCLLGDALISTRSRISNVYKRPYKGVMVNIRTRTGRAITITPNHPILTGRGWVNAGDINGGDKLVCDITADRFGNDQKHHVVAEFANLFSAAKVSVDPSFVTNRPTSTKDFHGDFTDGEVNIVRLDGLADYDIFKSCTQSIINSRLVFRPFAYFSFSALCRSVGRFRSAFASSGSFVSSANKAGYFFRAGIRHSCKLLFGAIPKFSVFLSQKVDNLLASAIQPKVAMNSCCTNAGFVGLRDSSLLADTKLDHVDGFAADPIGGKNSLNRFIPNSEQFSDLLNSQLINSSELDDVVDVFLSEVDTHVYNLENECNWYIANGIVAHNCRSVRVPVVKPEFQLPGFEGERSSVSGPVSSQTTYNSFLKRQSVEFQNEVLGPERAKLFRAGLNVDKFTDNAGRVLTLDELRAREGITLA